MSSRALLLLVVRSFFKKSEIKKNYDLGDQLGSGNFAVVKKAKNKNSGNGFPEDVAGANLYGCPPMAALLGSPHVQPRNAVA